MDIDCLEEKKERTNEKEKSEEKKDFVDEKKKTFHLTAKFDHCSDIPPKRKKK